MRRGSIAFAAAMCLLTGVAGQQPARSDVEGWREIAWPFPRDGWPAGRAFRCAMEACGGEVEIYLRPKIGFCNCDSGVADDDEVDRVADLDLMSERFAPLEPGQVIETHWPHGEDMPLAAGNVQLAWSEFEVVDSQLAVRVTRLA